jgi:diaminohydroxyphosphoribosylaminopyrimidine deaminase/5-amino-6-(5-phosphoribosylamino)uracil reductase
MKAAISRDNKIAAGAGRRTQLTSSDAISHAHTIRAEVDAIGVGSETVLVDDPLLTVRGIHRHRPLSRVLFDRRLRIGPSARVFSTLEAGPVIIVTTPEGIAANRQRAEDLERSGAQFEPITGGALPDAFVRLGGRDILSLVLEGGPTLQTAAWNAGIVDAVHLYVAPMTIGEAGVPWIDPAIVSVASLADSRSVQLGPDVFMEGYVHRID